MLDWGIDEELKQHSRRISSPLKPAAGSPLCCVNASHGTAEEPGREGGGILRWQRGTSCSVLLTLGNGCAAKQGAKSLLRNEKNVVWGGEKRASASLPSSSGLFAFFLCAEMNFLCLQTLVMILVLHEDVLCLFFQLCFHCNTTWKSSFRNRGLC